MKFIERVVLALLLASFSIQLGKHFWPSFAFVSGIRVDYISPTLYISDIFILMLILSSFYRIRSQIFTVVSHPLFIATYIALFLSTVVAIDKSAAIYGIIRFSQFAYLAVYFGTVAYGKLKDTLVFTLVLGGTVQAFILLFQFIRQSSLDGYFYLLGERSFSASTIGIATFKWGSFDLLRPYGTFPHPNVAAFYLFCAFTLLLSTLSLKRSFLSVVKICALLFLLVGICLTFSRIVMFLTIFVSLWYAARLSFRKKSSKIYFLGILTSFVLIFLALIFQRLEQSLLRDTLYRWELIEIAGSIFLKNMLFGVGLNNFFYHEILYQKNITPILLQPVHNIFALWTVQTGIFGLVIVAFFIKKLIKPYRWYKLALITSAVFVGLFDHYLITLQQGQLLLALIIGLCFQRENIKG